MLGPVLQFLKRNIQDGTHDSTEDAKAAMDLALLKIRKGESSLQLGTRLLLVPVLLVFLLLSLFLCQEGALSL
jgi:hypothetical protein